jgi:hypothetical protein
MSNLVTGFYMIFKGMTWNTGLRIDCWEEKSKGRSRENRWEAIARILAQGNGSWK